MDVAAALALTGCAAASPADDRRVVYLDFADGSNGVTLGRDDDASRDVSRLCEAETLARWEGAEDCVDRGSCAEQIRAAVEGYFAPYAVRVTTARPESLRYTKIVVTPDHPACAAGRRGVAHADCGDANPANIGFALDCQADVASCAVLIAHELAHTFGLVHVAFGGDLMTSAPEDPSLRFRDEALPALENDCGIDRQNAHRALLTVLGPAR